MLEAQVSIGLLAVGLVTLLWWLYRSALPRPLPGIPYAAASAQSLFGDVPAALKCRARTGAMMDFLVERGVELDSPVIQLFMRPFQQPWVVLLDGREAQDIMTRRGREFDRADFFGEMLKTTFPHNQVHMRTDDQWRFNRRLVGDAMSPAFLETTATPHVYASCTELIKLWKHKQRLAASGAVEVLEDLQMCTVDSIWAATFGVDLGSCQSQSQYLAQCKAQDTWLASKLYPELRWAIGHKNRLVCEGVDAAWARCGHGDIKGSAEVKSAVDLVLQREISFASKDGRAPNPNSELIRDELAGFLNAGFETTANTIAWGLKLLTKHREVQDRLRKDILSAFPHARETGSPLSAAEIAATPLVYLDAVIEEILRCSSVIPANVRMAVADTQLLGFRIPKGTNVFMPTMGPSFRSPSMPIDESQRSTSSREFHADAQRWAQQDLATFDPERWLTEVEGKYVFEFRAAPQQMFGAGVRSCFGRKLAYLQMRIILVLLVWSFDFLPTPPALSDFRAIDGITRQPQHVHLCLSTPAK